MSIVEDRLATINTPSTEQYQNKMAKLRKNAGNWNRSMTSVSQIFLMFESSNRHWASPLPWRRTRLHLIARVMHCTSWQAYVEMRKGGGRGSVTAYPRQLESLIRMSEAHAKTRLSQRVERADVQEALRLYREALKQSATDPRTGIVDISILTTGACRCWRSLSRCFFAETPERRCIALPDLS